jgi:hypothetical protein
MSQKNGQENVVMFMYCFNVLEIQIQGIDIYRKVLVLYFKAKKGRVVKHVVIE